MPSIQIKIHRLLSYRSALLRLAELGYETIFSQQIADAIGNTPAQVRKDFSVFGLTGRKRAGYRIAALLERLNAILGKDRQYDVVLAGAGKIGSALMEYQGFAKEGIRIAAAFDIDPAAHRPGSQSAVPVLPLERLARFVAEHGISVGIIAVPDIAAQHVLDLMAAAGIRGVLNFAPLTLRTPPGCTAANVNVAQELGSVVCMANAPPASATG